MKTILKVLSYILNILGIFLPFELITMDKFSEKYVTLKKLYTTFVIAVLFLLYISMQVEGTYYFKISRTSNIVLIIIVQTCLTFLIIIFLSCNTFMQCESWKQYCKLQKIVEHKLNIIEEHKRTKIYFIMEFTLGHFAFFVAVVLDYFRYYEHEQHFWTTVVIFSKNLLFYYVYIITTIILNTVLMLRTDFSTLKMYILSSLTENKIVNHNHSNLTLIINENVEIIRINDKTLETLLETSKILNILYELVTIFNNIFGKLILLITFTSVIVTLRCLNSILINGELNLLTLDIVAACVAEAIIFLTWSCFIIGSCSLLKKEGLSMISLCCKLQQLLPRATQERIEFLNLAHQIASRMPIVSAYGFFIVDLPLIFSIITCVGTYIVVLIQFSHIDF